jgi:hypothetical protein
MFPGVPQSEQPRPAGEQQAAAGDGLRPLVVQYLYVHGSGEAFDYPSARERSGSPARLAVRYLECVLVQAASLRLRGAACDLALVTNETAGAALDDTGRRLLAEIEAQGVEIIAAEYRHRPAHETTEFASSRYVFDAIETVGAGGDPSRPLWFVDVDCVWVDPGRALGSMPASPAIGCVTIPYPPGWHGADRLEIGAFAEQLGGEPGPPPEWIGGELLAGTAGELRALVATCESIEREAIGLGIELSTEEQLLSLAAALGRVSLHDMTHIARRIWTGPRHGAPPTEHPGTLALWHLPAEKGLSFRRAARQLRAGHGDRLRRDLADPVRAMRRFNVEGASAARRVRDDGWLLLQRALSVLRARR